jgi:methionyl-tRNA formyltransferase
MKVIFIGSVLFSEKLLNHIIKKKVNIKLIITKKVLKKDSDKLDLSRCAKLNNIPCIHVKNINDKKNLKIIKSNKPDIIFCLGWSEILNKQILKIPKLGVIGYHPSDLPHNRGKHPIIWSLVKGLKQTASTFFLLNESIDNGQIISKKKIKITFTDDANQLYKKLINSSKKQIDEIINNLKKRKIKKLPKSKSVGNYCRKRNYEDGLIDWRMSSISIHNLVRALTKPYNGAHFNYRSKEFKLWKVKIVNQIFTNAEPGKVIKEINNKPVIKCGDKSIILEKITPNYRFKLNSYLK